MYSNYLRRIIININKPKLNKPKLNKPKLNNIIYKNQYETRDFIVKKKINYDNIINYYDTNAFRDYKPNFK